MRLFCDGGARRPPGEVGTATTGHHELMHFGHFKDDVRTRINGLLGLLASPQVREFDVDKVDLELPLSLDTDEER